MLVCYLCLNLGLCFFVGLILLVVLLVVVVVVECFVLSEVCCGGIVMLRILFIYNKCIVFLIFCLLERLSR